MSDRMTEKNRYALWEYPQMLQHFEHMAKNGWMLAECNEVQFEYKADEPKRVHFAATFFPDYDFLDPNPPESLERLWTFCRESGWRHITDNASMQIFCNDEENPVPLHTDAVVQLENFHSMIDVSKLKLWRQQAVINGLFIVLLAVISAMLARDVSFEGLINRISPVALLILAFYTYKFASSVCGLAAYYSWYRKAVVQAQEKDVFITFMPNKIWANADMAISAFFLFGMIVLFAKSGETASTILFSIPFVALFFVIYALTRYMKNNGVSAKENRRITCVVVAVLILLFVMVLPYIIMTIADMGLGGDMITVTRTFPS